MLTFLARTYLHSNQIILGVRHNAAKKVVKSGCYYTVTVFSKIPVTLLKEKMQKQNQKNNTGVKRTNTASVKMNRMESLKPFSEGQDDSLTEPGYHSLQWYAICLACGTNTIFVRHHLDQNKNKNYFNGH